MRTSTLLSITFFLLTAVAQAVTVQVNVMDAICGNANGSAYAYASGGIAPYTYQWNTGATTASIENLPPGTYTVTVTDANAQTAMASGEVVNVMQLFMVGNNLSYLWNQAGGEQLAMHPCPGFCNGGLTVHLENLGGTPPYNVSFLGGQQPTGVDELNNPVFNGFCDNEVATVFISDATGCFGQGDFPIQGPNADDIEIVNIEGACNGANGSITLSSANMQGWQADVSVYTDQGVLVVPPQYFSTPELTIGELPPGDYELHEDWWVTPVDCIETYPFTIPDFGNTCGTVSGKLYLDHDQDCVEDGLDEGVPYRLLELTPGPEYAMTDADGNYTRNLPYGTYTIIPSGSDLYQICPPPPAQFTLDAGQSLITLDLADSSLVPLDLSIEMDHGPVRPGFVANVYGMLQNLSGQLSGAVQVQFTFDPVLSFVEAYPTPTSVIGNVITWDIPDLTAYDHTSFGIYLQVPPDVTLIGTTVQNTITATASQTEISTANNTWTEVVTVTGSYDPNDKQVTTGPGGSNEFFLVDQDTILNYTIRFQNTGTDTAFTVAVVDTISMDLDLSTLKITNASHPFVPTFDAPRVLRFTFPNILLPDSNTNEPLSHGLISFSIKPMAPVLPGTVYSNAGDIFFDFNPPIRTNDAVVTATTPTVVPAHAAATMIVYPNPASDVVTITFATAGPHLLRLHDARGRQLREIRAGGPSHRMNLRDLPAGMYHLRDAGTGAVVKVVRD
jgi:uncharacterized repeat protein (TIGR01451 family)